MTDVEDFIIPNDNCQEDDDFDEVEKLIKKKDEEEEFDYDEIEKIHQEKNNDNKKDKNKDKKDKDKKYNLECTENGPYYIWQISGMPYRTPRDNLINIVKEKKNIAKNNFVRKQFPIPNTYLL